MDAIYEKHGAMKAVEPLFTPDARGMLMVVELKSKDDKLSDEQLAMINLHAQGELKAASDEYRRAQEWWSNLPKTPARQMDNGYFTLSSFDVGKAQIEAWQAQYDEKDGLVYIFGVERKLNLRTGTTQRHIPVMVFSGGGFETLDSIEEKDCVNYRLYFAYYEKPETLTEKIHGLTDSLTVVEKQELHY